MALDSETLENDLKRVFMTATTAAAAGKGDQSDNVIRELAAGIAAAVDQYVRSATVSVSSVSGVTTGTAVSGPGTGTLT